MSRGGDAKRWIHVSEDPTLTGNTHSMNTLPNIGSSLLSLLIDFFNFIISIIEKPEEFTNNVKERVFTLLYIIAIVLFTFLLFLWVRQRCRATICKSILQSD